LEDNILKALTMSADWKAELQRLKIQPVKKGAIQNKINTEKTELKRLMKMLKTQLRPVVETFTEQGKTKMRQPHIHEHSNGYTLVLPVVKEGIEHITLRLQFEFSLAENGYILKAIGETEKNMPAPEKTIETPITEEKIRDEIRDFLRKRQIIILKLKKRKTS
jgi:hypothetical protein